MKVRFNRNLCVGCDACNTICPKFWGMKTDGKIILTGGKEISGRAGWFEKELDVKDEDCNKKAADICPVKVIHVLG